MEGSIIELIGGEIIGVMSSFSISMVLFVYSSLSKPSPHPIRTVVNLVYLESPSDSTSKKLEGSLLNAVVFIVLVAIVTFMLVILYYYNFISFLKNYIVTFLHSAFRQFGLVISLWSNFSSKVLPC